MGRHSGVREDAGFIDKSRLGHRELVFLVMTLGAWAAIAFIGFGIWAVFALR